MHRCCLIHNLLGWSLGSLAHGIVVLWYVLGKYACERLDWAERRLVRYDHLPAVVERADVELR